MTYQHHTVFIVTRGELYPKDKHTRRGDQWQPYWRMLYHRERGYRRHCGISESGKDGKGPGLEKFYFGHGEFKRTRRL